MHATYVSVRLHKITWTDKEIYQKWTRKNGESLWPADCASLCMVHNQREFHCPASWLVSSAESNQGYWPGEWSNWLSRFRYAKIRHFLFEQKHWSRAVTIPRIKKCDLPMFWPNHRCRTWRMKKNTQWICILYLEYQIILQHSVRSVFYVFTLKMQADKNLYMTTNTSRVVFDFSKNMLQLQTLHSTSTLLLLFHAYWALPSDHVYILSDCKKEPEQELPSLHTMVGADPWQPPCCSFPESLGLVDSCLVHLLPLQPLTLPAESHFLRSCLPCFIVY